MAVTQSVIRDLLGLVGTFAGMKVTIIVYYDEMGGARVFKPSWMTGRNKSLPYAHTRSAARFLSSASIVFSHAFSLMLGFDISFLPTHCNFANFLIFIPH